MLRLDAWSRDQEGNGEDAGDDGDVSDDGDCGDVVEIDEEE